MSVLLLESGSKTLLQSGDSLLLEEPTTVVIETSFLRASIGGPDCRRAIRALSRATFDQPANATWRE